MGSLRLALGSTLLVLAAATARASAADTAVEDRQLLQQARVRTDGPSLLAFFARRTPTEVTLRRIGLLTRQLGDPSFRIRDRASRELISYGRLAVAGLQQAEHLPDLEVAWRAEECLKSIEAADDSALVAAAVRQLGLLKPPGTAEVLLAYVPYAGGSLVRDEVVCVLTTVAVRDSRPEPALVAALGDADAERRVAAVEALSQAGAADKLPGIARLLHEPLPSARLPIAVALAKAGVRDAVPVLIELAADLPPEQGWQADEILQTLADHKGPAVVLDADAPARRKYRDAWDAWWRTSGADIDLARLRRAPSVLGYTLVLLLDAGKLREVDASGNKRWEFGGLSFPLDAQMIGNDRVLVTEFHANRITERDRSGRVLWEKEVLAPLTAQRLPNGHTFVASQADLYEFDRDGKQIWSLAVPDLIYKAAKLSNGDVAYISGRNEYARIDMSQKDVARFPAHLDYSGGRLDVLPNGHVVVPEANDNRVVEYDTHGKIVWEASADSPVAAMRLASGNTLVTSHQSTRGLEIDRHGNVVWQYKADTRVSRLFRR